MGEFDGPRGLSLALVVIFALAAGAPLAAPAAEALTAGCPPPVTPPLDAIDDLPNPPVIRSENGVLEATLKAAPSEVTVAGATFTSNVFNGDYTPPTLLVRRGDDVRLTVVNTIDKADIEIDKQQQTNVHFHGMDVTPKPPGDSVFIRIGRGKTFENKFRVPADHPEGLHWYHAHLHGRVEAQILSGLSGMLIVQGAIPKHYPELVGLRSRVMVLKANTLPGNDPGCALTKTINGFANAPIRSRPGAFQIWQIGNLGADAFYNLALDGHDFWVLERDGNLLLKPVRQKTLFLPAGARTLVAVEAGEPGRYALRSLAVDTGPQGDPNPEVVFGTFIVGGPPIDQPGIARRLRKPAANIATIVPRPDQIAKLPITGRRVFTFSETANGNTFFINNKTYKQNVINTTVPLGAVEEWTLRNTSGELHVFHIHQMAFLVTKVQGQTADYPGLRDVIDIPYQENGEPGEVKMIVPFTNPIMVGEFVYHCHIVGHEDAGMMANVEVVTPGTLARREVLNWVRDFVNIGLPKAWAGSTSRGQGDITAADLEGQDICRADAE